MTFKNLVNKKLKIQLETHNGLMDLILNSNMILSTIKWHGHGLTMLKLKKTSISLLQLTQFQIVNKLKLMDVKSIVKQTLMKKDWLSSTYKMMNLQFQHNFLKDNLS